MHIESMTHGLILQLINYVDKLVPIFQILLKIRIKRLPILTIEH